MNRILSTLVVALALALPGAAVAATINLSPMSVTVTPGKTFVVTVTADPSGTKAYTVRANVSFDPSLVQVTGFTLSPKWLALQASGYDSIDNTGGTLVKTAGYPGGLTAPTTFGTVTFTAKAAGVAHITVSSQSMVLDENSKNALSGTKGATEATISAPTPVKTETKTTATKPAVKSTTKPAVTKVAATTPSSTTAAAATTSATSTIATTSALAAAGATGFALGSVSGMTLIVFVIAIIAGGFWYYRRRVN